MSGSVNDKGATDSKRRFAAATTTISSGSERRRCSASVVERREVNGDGHWGVDCKRGNGNDKVSNRPSNRKIDTRLFYAHSNATHVRSKGQPNEQEVKRAPTRK